MVNITQISCNYLILFHTQFLRIFWKDSNVSFSVTTFEVYDMNIVLNDIFNYALIPDHIIWVLYPVDCRMFTRFGKIGNDIIYFWNLLNFIYTSNCLRQLTDKNVFCHSCSA